MTPEEIARSYIGTPYAHQGRRPKTDSDPGGLDCLGLLICVGRQMGYVASDFDVSNYAMKPNKTSIIEGCEEYLVRVSRDEAKPSDVIVVAWDSHPQHFGIMGTYRLAPEHRTIIHAFQREGDKKACVTEHRLTADMMRRIVRVYRFPERA